MGSFLPGFSILTSVQMKRLGVRNCLGSTETSSSTSISPTFHQHRPFGLEDFCTLCKMNESRQIREYFDARLDLWWIFPRWVSVPRVALKWWFLQIRSSIVHLPFQSQLAEKMIKEGENVKNNFGGSKMNIIINCNVPLDVDEPVYVDSWGFMDKKLARLQSSTACKRLTLPTDLELWIVGCLASSAAVVLSLHHNIHHGHLSASVLSAGLMHCSIN